MKKEDKDVEAAMVGQVKKREDTNREIMGISMDGCCIRTIEEWREAKNGVIFDVCHDAKGKPHAVAKSYISRIENSEEFGKRLYTEAKQRNSEAAKKIIVVGDGARWIWEEATLHFPESVQIVDWYHAKEHLWKAAELIFGSREKEESKEWIKKTRNILFSGEVESLAEEMAKECKRQNKKITDELKTEQNYFVKNKDRMQYSRFEKLGYPIGSGTVESACKNLVQIRMKRCGMKWTEEGAHAVLKLRCMLLSDRWNEVEGNCLVAA